MSVCEKKSSDSILGKREEDSRTRMMIIEHKFFVMNGFNFQGVNIFVP